MDTRRPCRHLLAVVSDVVIGYTKTILYEFDKLQIRLTNHDSLFTMNFIKLIKHIYYQYFPQNNYISLEIILFDIL